MARRKKSSCSTSGIITVMIVLLAFYVIGAFVEFSAANPVLVLGGIFVVIAAIGVAIIVKKRKDERIAREDRTTSFYKNYLENLCNLKTARNVETALNEYGTALNNMKALADISADEQTYIGITKVFSPDSITDFETQKDSFINDAINKSFTDMMVGAYSLKT